MLRGLAHREGSRLQVTLPDGDMRRFGPHGAERRLEIRVHDNRFFTRLLLGGATGAGESYTAGEWEADDLKRLVQAVLHDSESVPFDALPSLPAAFVNGWRHWRRANTRVGSARNVEAHYDLGNRFFELFLDPSLTYSCAVWQDGDDLERAQWRK